jgi:hypothetical protein
VGATRRSRRWRCDEVRTSARAISTEVSGRLLGPDALEDSVDTESAGDLADTLHGLLAALRTTSVALSSRASLVRSSWRPTMMICSAPRRLAAITPHRPTAPSPTTVTHWLA